MYISGWVHIYPREIEREDPATPRLSRECGRCWGAKPLHGAEVALPSCVARGDHVMRCFGAGMVGAKVPRYKMPKLSCFLG